MAIKEQYYLELARGNLYYPLPSHDTPNYTAALKTARDEREKQLRLLDELIAACANIHDRGAEASVLAVLAQLFPSITAAQEPHPHFIGLSTIRAEAIHQRVYLGTVYAKKSETALLKKARTQLLKWYQLSSQSAENLELDADDYKNLARFFGAPPARKELGTLVNTESGLRQLRYALFDMCTNSSFLDALDTEPLAVAATKPPRPSGHPPLTAAAVAKSASSGAASSVSADAKPPRPSGHPPLTATAVAKSASSVSAAKKPPPPPGSPPPVSVAANSALLPQGLSDADIVTDIRSAIADLEKIKVAADVLKKVSVSDLRHQASTIRQFISDNGGRVSSQDKISRLVDKVYTLWNSISDPIRKSQCELLTNEASTISATIGASCAQLEDMLFRLEHPEVAEPAPWASPRSGVEDVSEKIDRCYRQILLFISKSQDKDWFAIRDLYEDISRIVGSRDELQRQWGHEVERIRVTLALLNVNMPNGDPPKPFYRFDIMDDKPTQQQQAQFGTSQYILTPRAVFYYHFETKMLIEISSDSKMLSSLRGKFPNVRDMLSYQQLIDMISITGHSPITEQEASYFLENLLLFNDIVNMLSLSLPATVADVPLVESLRIYVPQLYSVIKDNSGQMPYLEAALESCWRRYNHAMRPDPEVIPNVAPDMAAKARFELGQLVAGLEQSFGHHQNVGQNTPVVPERPVVTSPVIPSPPPSSNYIYSESQGILTTELPFITELIEKSEIKDSLSKEKPTLSSASVVEINTEVDASIRYHETSLAEDKLIRSSAYFQDNEKHGILTQDNKGHVADHSDDDLTAAQSALMAFQQAKMLLENYDKKQGDIIIKGTDKKQAQRVYAALLFLKEGQSVFKNVNIRSFACKGPDYSTAGRFQRAKVKQRYIQDYLLNDLDKILESSLQQQVKKQVGDAAVRFSRTRVMGHAKDELNKLRQIDIEPDPIKAPGK